jgi:hypothetical protein
VADPSVVHSLGSSEQLLKAPRYLQIVGTQILLSSIIHSSVCRGQTPVMAEKSMVVQTPSVRLRREVGFQAQS